MPGSCAACPYRDRPEPCWAAPPHRRRVCDLAAGGSVGHIDMVRRMTTGEEPAPPPAPDRVAVASATAQVREALAVNRCKVRQAIGCGCQDRSALCFRSGLPAVVTREHCGACVSGAPPLTAARRPDTVRQDTEDSSTSPVSKE